MPDHAGRNPPERPVGPVSRRPVGWREILTRAHLPRLLTLCLAVWLHAANSMLTATTLPVAVGDIGGLRLISWAFALYLMGSIVAATAVSVWVATHGLRRTMMASTLVYTLGGVLCAVAPAMPVLLAGRIVQGLGGGALVALVYIAQDRFFPNRLVPRIIACLSVVWTASALCGPLIGGAFATAGLWRFAFWSFALQGLLLAVALHPLLARTHSGVAIQARRIPVARLAFVAGAILAISFAGAVTSTAFAVALVLSGCVCLGLFVARDSAAGRTRLLPDHATDLDHPVGSGIAMTFLLSLSMMSFVVYGPILLIRLYELTPLQGRPRRRDRGSRVGGRRVLSVGSRAGARRPLDPHRQRPAAGRTGGAGVVHAVRPALAHRGLGILRHRRLRHDVGIHHQDHGRACPP